MNAETIKNAVADSGYKQKYIAEKIGITPTYLNNILNGKRPLKLHIEKKIVELLGL